MPEETATSIPLPLLIAMPFLFGAVFIGFWCFVCKLISLIGGWNRMAKKFRTEAAPTGKKLKMQGGKVGIINYNNCLHVHVSELGIHLSIMPIFRFGHPPLMIPWQEVHHMRKGKFLWVDICTLQVGDPKVASITLAGEVYDSALEFASGSVSDNTAKIST